MRKIAFISMWLLIGSLGYAQYPYSADYMKGTQAVQSYQGVGKTIPTLVNDSAAWGDPKRATVLALVLPGAGQIYNKKYWKAGIVYAGIGGLAYMWRYNTDSLARYQKILVSKINGDTNTIDLSPNRSTASIRSDRDFHRRYRDVSLIGFVVLYALQAIDANVDAHLKEFKVNKDLSMKIQPDICTVKSGMGLYNGFTVTLKF
jgi:hypothetical protein